MDKVIQSIKNYKNIAILTHISEDGDALGSALAFASAMKNEGKKADVFISEQPPQNLGFMENNFIIYTPDCDVSGYDLCVCLDCADLKRLGRRVRIFDEIPHTVNIDHHITNTLYAEANYVEAEVSSTGEILFGIFNAMGTEITKEIAEYLYISIASDTGCFKYSSVTPKTMIIGAKLLEKGIDHAEICRKLFDTETRPALRIKGYIMQNISEFFDGKVCMVALEKKIFDDFGVNEKDVEDIVNIPRSVKGCEIAVSIREDTDKLKISFRSNGKYNVSDIAAAFGGGGHKMAAGATMTQTDIKTAVELIKNECGKVL